MDFKDEWEALCSDTIDIKIRARYFQNTIIPDNTGNEILLFKLRKMTCEDHWKVEKESLKYSVDSTRECEGGKPYEITYIDYQQFKKEIICRMLFYVSFYELKMKDDQLDEESKRYILNLPSPIIQAVLEQYEKTINVSEEEEDKITKQSAILFSKSSKGVDNACEAINIFCNYGNFWEKFGLNMFELKKIPYKEYVMLKMVVSKENQSNASKNSASKAKNRNISINGKTQKSNAITIPDRGQEL